VVGGKTITNDRDDQAVVLIAADLTRDSSGAAQYWCAGTIAHEYTHLLYGAERRASIGQTENVWLPWEVAGMIGVLAAEEYRVNRIAQVLVEKLLPATDDHGAPVSLASVLRLRYLAGLASSLDAVVPGLPHAVEEYRHHRTTLDQMWQHVARVSEEITLFCAHSEAHRDASDPPLLEMLPEHPSRELLDSVWSPLAAHLADSPPLPARDDWAADRQRIQAIARDAWMSAWERLGLRPTPHGDTFHLAVSAPRV
jgi:hypothetical protein